jgi:site-specific DNA-methyltransferase (adenine-specific)
MINITNEDNMQLMARYEDKHFDLAIVDPPYGINRNGMNMGNSVFNKDDKKWDDNVPTDNYFKELFRISKNQIIWGGNYFNLPCSQYFAIWDKGETMYARDFAEVEYAWVRKGGTRIYKKSPNQPDRIHPTQKPVKLYEWLLLNYAKEGDKILDTHGGSLSIALAVHNVNTQNKMNLTLDVCELDKDYYLAGKERLRKHQQQLTIF